MDIDKYQKEAISTAIFDGTPFERLAYVILKLNGEAGELAEKFAKWSIRDGKMPFTDQQIEELVLELGDVLWYVSAISKELHHPLSLTALKNLDKLRDRKQRSALHGSGDNR